MGGYELVRLPRIDDARGSLTAIEGGRTIPFKIERVYYLYDVPAGAMRAGHAHYELNQLIIACSGSFDVNLDDGVNKVRLTLNRPDVGLLLSTMIWRTIDNFSSGASCVVLASHHYDEADYIRDYDQFIDHVRGPDGR